MKKLSVLFAAVVSFAVFAEEVPTMKQGWGALDSGKHQEAEKIFRAVSQLPNQNYDGTIGIMFALRRQKKNEQVIAEADKWIAENPKATVNQKVHLLLFKGNALRDLKKTDECLATYKNGVDLKSTNHLSSDCAKEYLVVACNAGKKDLALDMYNATKDDPIAMKNIGYLSNAAWLCWQLKKGEEGLKVLDSLEKLKIPEWVKETIGRTRGYLYRDCFDDCEKAVKSFEYALATPNLNEFQKAVLWNNIGIAYEREEEYEKAVEAYKKVGTFKASGWFMKSAANAAIRLQKKIDAGE